MRTAVLSDCGTYRYRLGRRWGVGTSLLWVMLNPSIADAYRDDPTIRRCIGFASAWGHDAIEVVNLYALRATDPGELRDHPDPVGPDNADTLHGQIGHGGHAGIVAAWGAAGEGAHMASHVAGVAAQHGRSIFCLGRTKSGHPRHPLYVHGDTDPEPWRTPSGADLVEG